MALASLRKFVQLTLVLTALALSSASALAQEPNDMKPGSVLFFNKYTSNPTNPQASDTQISITNTNTTESASVHLFFVDGGVEQQVPQPRVDFRLGRALRVPRMRVREQRHGDRERKQRDRDDRHAHPAALHE